MIQIIRELCQKAGCQPKDLVVEWTAARGACLIGTNAQGEKTYLNVLARLDHIAQAIWLCANGQENLYPQIQEQQAALDAQVKEWLTENSDKCDPQWGCPEEEFPLENAEGPKESDWRQLNTVGEIMRAFPRHPSPDDIIDLYQRNKNFKSSDLKALLEKHSR
jgi:hypothetical protein